MPSEDPSWRDLPLARWAPRSQLRVPVNEVPRPAVPALDVHNHLGRWLSEDGDWLVGDVAELLGVLDECGVATVVNLDGRWGGELAENLDRYDRAHPGRFVTFCQLDFSVLCDGGPGDSGPTQQLVRSLEASAAQGARGVKVWKDLGLTWRDDRGELVLPGDERLSDVFDAAGELGMPVLIHTADPVAFFDPLDRHNERLDELRHSPDWWFGDRSVHPSFETLMASLEALLGAHPRTSFIGAHVGCHAEDLGHVSSMLGRFPNFAVDTGGRLAELGRQPRAFARLLREHPDQVLFGTDAYPPYPDAYRTFFRFVETADEGFRYEPDADVPPQGRWDISGADIDAEMLPGFYAGNARRILGLG